MTDIQGGTSFVLGNTSKKHDCEKVRGKCTGEIYWRIQNQEIRYQEFQNVRSQQYAGHLSCVNFVMGLAHYRVSVAQW